MARNIAYKLFIEWDHYHRFSDESAFLVEASGSLRLSAPESSISSPRGIVDDCTLTLDNSTGRYSPLNFDSPLFAWTANGGAYQSRMHLEVSIDGGLTYTRVFTGVVKIPQEAGGTTQIGATVTLDCRSRDETILSQRRNTKIEDFVNAHDEHWLESDYMRLWLHQCALTEGHDFVLDQGLYIIPYAWLDEESPLEELWLLAAACGGRFYCDPEGIFRYESMTHWLTDDHLISQETLTRSDFERCEPYYEDRELYQAVTVELAERVEAQYDTIWQADEVVSIPANSTRVLTAKLRQPATLIDGVVVSAVTSGAKRIDSDVTVTAVARAANVLLTLANANTTFAAHLTTLALTGIALDGTPAGEETAESTDAFWSTRQGRTKLVRGNVYLQSRAQAERFARFLRDRYQAPRLFYRLRGTPGIPARRLGRRITIYDSSLMTGPRQAYILEIQWRLTQSGFVQDLLAVDAADLYPDDAGYFILGTSLLNGDKALFY